MKLNELNTQTLFYFYNLSAANAAGPSNENIFQLMSAEDLNVSHLSEIERELKNNFPFNSHDLFDNRHHDIDDDITIEFSGKLARVIFTITHINSKHSDEIHKGKCTIYIYLYKNEWIIM